MFSFMITTITTAVLLMHPVHQTVSEMEWNRQTGCVEVALRLDVLDEQWIRRQAKDRNRAGWQAGYLQSRWSFAAGEDSVAEDRWAGKPIRWVGRKQDGGYVWWFFEVVCEDGAPPTSVRTRLLFDREPGYDHRIILLNCVKSSDDEATRDDRCSVVLNEAQPQAELSFAAR
jgi:hypothetical protein